MPLNTRDTNDIDISSITKTLLEVDVAVQNKIKHNRDTLVNLADEMAECATTFKGQGYTGFLKSRDKFVGVLDEINSEYKELFKVIRK